MGGERLRGKPKEGGKNENDMEKINGIICKDEDDIGKFGILVEN